MVQHINKTFDMGNIGRINKAPIEESFAKRQTFYDLNRIKMRQ